MVRSLARKAGLLAIASLTACSEGSVPPVVAPTEPSVQRAGVGGAEVWVVDQSNSTGLQYGGAIHIYSASDLMGQSASAAQAKSVIDLAGTTAALCTAETGVNPVRPHMIFFNRTHTHAVLAFVGSGHVVVFDAAAQSPVACIRTSPGAGGSRQAHAAVPAPDDSHILVANQNGKLLERIDSDFTTNSFSLNPLATIDLAACVTGSGAPCQAPGLRPDNAPICPMYGRADPTVAWITLRGGGLLVVDPTTTPMKLIGEYDVDAIHPNGCGGSEAGGRMFVTSGGGTPANLHEFDLYALPLGGYDAANPPNTPARTVILSDDVAPRDGHGTAVVGGNLWVFDRGANVAEVFNPVTGAHQGTVELAGAVAADPSPDLADASPAENRLFVSLRGSHPLTGDPHVSTGDSPGVGVVRVTSGGRRGTLAAVARISNVDGSGIDRADPHGIRVRRP